MVLRNVIISAKFGGLKTKKTTGSCWAFSAASAAEGITMLKTGRLISLSEQELVDCHPKSEDQGCQDGMMEHTFKVIVRNNGITSEANYTYRAADGTCNRKKEASLVAKIRRYENVPASNEADLLKPVANQPVSVSIDAGGIAFHFYSSGVFTGDSGTDLDHCVAVRKSISECREV